MLSFALAGMIDDVRAHAGAVYLMSDADDVLEMAVMAGLPRAFAAPWERVALSARIPVADAARDRRLVWVPGEEAMARRYPRISVVLPYPFSLAAVPVATPRAVYGAVFVTWPGSRKDDLSPAERTRLVAACDRLAIRLEQAAERGRRVTREADFIGTAPPAGSSAEAARMVARLPDGICSLDIDARITFANTAMGELVGAPAARLVGRILWSALPWLDDPVHEDRYRAALMSQQGTSFVALRPPREWLEFRLHPSRSGITVQVGPAGPDARREAPDAPLPGGRTAAPARDRVPAAGPAPERTDDGPRNGSARLIGITHLLSLAGALTEAVGVSDVVELVADEIMPAVGSSALVVLAAEGGRLRVLGHRGYDDPMIVGRFDGMPLTAPTPGARALATGVPSFFATRAELEHIHPVRTATPDGLAAWAYLPLIASGRPVGTCVLGYAEPHRFGTDERAMLTSLGGLMAQALERARLYDAKHRLAHGLQSALLPHSLPLLPGLDVAARYLPGTQGMDIGGDFYDLMRTDGDGAPSDDGRGRGGAVSRIRPDAAAVIGDVQGHNVAAAGMMGQVRTAVRAYTAAGQSPGRVMSSTNRLLIDLDADLLASCLYVHLDLEGRRVLLARAGHPQPLLRDPEGRVHVLDLAGGPLLGVDPSAVYPTTSVPLPPGSVLVFYTDGLIERPGTDIDDALAELAGRLAGGGTGEPLEELADTLLGDAPSERGDDTALLLLRTRDRT
ncbi:SpoIIE family protein phosphatase [Streptomyces sp. t39]|uniref:SpoIIE family protein phosphatase n=1 Tax=Streptomyces sp. t39 TaxID=1828156 RepID=UPI0011CDA0CC|nr:SpoIIE family protein phosphatase [Streptomyces sp. t39]TXS47888.1 PAS domain-containing protein [Streptomyces sp. t39]